MPRALVLVADGFVDDHVHGLGARLHAQGFEVVHVGAKRGAEASGRSGRTVTADRSPLDLNLHSYDLAVLPDGACAAAFAENKSFVNIVYSMLHKGRVVLAIGASVKALIPAQEQKTSPNPVAGGIKVLDGEILKGRRIACVDAVAADIEKAGGLPAEDGVVTDGPVVTALGDAPLDAMVAAAVPTAWRFRALVH